MRNIKQGSAKRAPGPGEAGRSWLGFSRRGGFGYKVNWYATSPSPMTNHFDFYEEARNIANALRPAGQKKWADAILEKIEAGSTSTEILMGVRWVFQQCLENRKNKMEDIDKRMLALVSKIDGALK